MRVCHACMPSCREFDDYRDASMCSSASPALLCSHAPYILHLLYRPCNQQFAGFKSDSNSFLAVQTLQIKPTNRWLTLKLSKVINIHSPKWIPYWWEFVSSDTSVLYFALMGSLYRAGITPLRGLYTCYTGNMCTLLLMVTLYVFILAT